MKKEEIKQKIQEITQAMNVRANQVVEQDPIFRELKGRIMELNEILKLLGDDNNERRDD